MESSLLRRGPFYFLARAEKWGDVKKKALGAPEEGKRKRARTLGRAFRRPPCSPFFFHFRVFFLPFPLH